MPGRCRYRTVHPAIPGHLVEASAGTTQPHRRHPWFGLAPILPVAPPLRLRVCLLEGFVAARVFYIG